MGKLDVVPLATTVPLRPSPVGTTSQLYEPVVPVQVKAADVFLTIVASKLSALTDPTKKVKLLLVAVLVATHDREMIKRVARRSITLDHGRLVDASH